MKHSRSTIHPEARAINAIIRFIGTCFLCGIPLLLTSSTPPNLLERLIHSGVMPVISSNGPSTFYEGPLGNTGFEYDLAYGFAEELGVELTIIDKENPTTILQSVSQGDGLFAAAGLSIYNNQANNSIRFTTPYSKPTLQIIYQRNMRKPQSIEDIIDKDIAVIADSIYTKTLRDLRQHHPELSWREIPNANSADMLEMVHTGRAEITLTNTTAFITNSVLFPRARVAFLLAKEDRMAWAFPDSSDNSLYNAANRYIDKVVANGTVATLKEQYFSKPTVDEGNALALVKRIEERLPQWVPFFKDSAKVHDLDWLFLAAVSYQESLWNKDAKSYTGVRGLMMLTTQTAKGLGIEDRTDPQQSIEGGARYFVNVRKRLPDGIEEPDRTWMALAAYNIGLGHLEDARVLTQRNGKDPNLWDDVKQHLPLLAKRKYYRTTRHGYARGWEPVTYVKRIRNYHNILIWHYENMRRQEAIATDTTINSTNEKTADTLENMSQL
ncbi:membrane-bound lytic murein transglycosylase MltF [Eionea flava]